MKKLIISCLILLLAGCMNSDFKDVKQSHYFYGDSTTLGYGVKAEESYVAVYAANIKASRIDRTPTPNKLNGDISDATISTAPIGESNIVVTRDGGGGRPVVSANGAGLLRDYISTVRASGWHDLLIIQCGINDAIQNNFKNETPEQFRENLERLILLAKQDSNRVYMIAPTYVSNAVADSVKDYLRVMKEVGIKTNIQVIEPPASESWYSEDIYHPNVEGHKVIGDYITNIIN